jgi:arginine-tRNA-protein transferase
MISNISWYLSNDHPCPYFENRNASNVFCQEDYLNAQSYEILQEQGFRRSGHTFYKPQCKTCSDCIPLRIKANQFNPSKSQRKIKNKNSDLTTTWTSLKSDSEHIDLYNNYQNIIHDGRMSANEAAFIEMFSHKGYVVSEIQFRLDNKLIGVSIIDLGINSLSSVYFYYDPQFSKRSLGTYSVLIEIQSCIEKNIDFWYGGYAISNCKKMSYKTKFQPAEYFYNKSWQTDLPENFIT